MTGGVPLRYPGMGGHLLCRLENVGDREAHDGRGGVALAALFLWQGS
jgi:hypothetical protein